MFLMVHLCCRHTCKVRRNFQVHGYRPLWRGDATAKPPAKKLFSINVSVLHVVQRWRLIYCLSFVRFPWQHWAWSLNKYADSSEWDALVDLEKLLNLSGFLRQTHMWGFWNWGPAVFRENRVMGLMEGLAKFSFRALRLPGQVEKCSWRINKRKLRPTSKTGRLQKWREKPRK